MSLRIGAMGSSANPIGAGGTDIGIERITRLKANPRPFASGLGHNNLNLDIEVVGFLDIRHGDFIIAVPFFPATIQDIEPGISHRYDLPGPYGHTRLGPFNRAHGKWHAGQWHYV